MGCAHILSVDTWVDLILIIVMGMNFSGMFSTPLCRHMGRSNFSLIDLSVALFITIGHFTRFNKGNIFI